MHYRYCRPKIIVDYLREPYIAKENRIRITFDPQIVATEASFDLFDSKLTILTAGFLLRDAGGQVQRLSAQLYQKHS